MEKITKCEKEGSMKNLRGCFVSTKKVKVDGISLDLKQKYCYQVLVLDLTESKLKYTKEMAIDSLNNMGWCKFDDVVEALGEKQANKVVKYCEQRNKPKTDGVWWNE